MQKMKAYFNEALCKGCRLCVGACPVNAIVPLERLNQKGYPLVEIDTEKCIGCGFCYKTCPDYAFEVK